MISVLYLLVAVAGAIRRVTRKPGHGETGKPPRSILVIRLDLMGDVVFTMPAVAALHAAFPGARITLLTLPYTAPIVAMYAGVDQSVSMDTNAIRKASGLMNLSTWRSYAKTLRFLRVQDFDVAISMSGRTASLCAALSGARCTIGYAREAYPFLLDRVVPGGRYHERIHEIEYCLRLAAEAGGSASREHARPVPPAEGIDRLDVLLRAEGVDPVAPITVLHIGAGHGSAKRWPHEHWADLIVELRRIDPDSRVLVLAGGGEDRRDAELIARRSGEGVVSLVGKTDIGTLAALLSRAEVTVSGDSGPLHLAAALGTPTVAIFGPTDPKIYGPQHGMAEHRMLWRELPCSPCYNARAAAECPLGHRLCMRLINPAEVAAAVQSVAGENS